MPAEGQASGDERRRLDVAFLFSAKGIHTGRSLLSPLKCCETREGCRSRRPAPPVEPQCTFAVTQDGVVTTQGIWKKNPHVLAHIDQPPLSYWPPQRHAAEQRECNVPASLGNYQREKITHSVTSWCSRLRGVERWIVGFISERLLTAPVMSHGVHRSTAFKAAH